MTASFIIYWSLLTPTRSRSTLPSPETAQRVLVLRKPFALVAVLFAALWESVSCREFFLFMPNLISCFFPFLSRSLIENRG